MKKTLIKTSLMFVLSVFTLTGCFGAGNEPQTTDPQATQSAQIQQKPEYTITNTNKIELSGGSIIAQSGVLLKAYSESEQINVSLIASNETLVGDIICDKSSSVYIELKDNSTLKGAINKDDTASSVTVSLDASSVLTITSNAYITNLTDDDETLSNIHDDGHTIYYDPSSVLNDWLGGKTYLLPNGGKLTPRSST